MNTETQVNDVKTIDVVAKEWRDKVNGNSYFSAQVTASHEVIIFDFKCQIATIIFQGSKDECDSYVKNNSGIVVKIL